VGATSWSSCGKEALQAMAAQRRQTGHVSDSSNLSPAIGSSANNSFWSSESAKEFRWVDPICAAKGNQLDDINATLSRFTLCHKRLRLS
jgi:hypothetical protein